MEHAASPGAPRWLSAPGLISACTPCPCQPPWALIDSKNMLASSWDRYCGFGRKLKGVCPVSWMEMSALALLPGVEQPGFGGDFYPPGPKTPIWGPTQLGPFAVPPPGTTTTIPRQRYLSPASYIWGPDTFPHPRKLIPVPSLLSELSSVACCQIFPCFEHLRRWLCSHWGPSLALWDQAYLGELVLLVANGQAGCGTALGLPRCLLPSCRV